VPVEVTVTDEEDGVLLIEAGLAADARIAVRGAVALKSAWLQAAD
jgi:hypothetical protein